jgi:two-component sensor histidine kinase/ABC-type amino acid transport substrate-binding protein
MPRLPAFLLLALSLLLPARAGAAETAPRELVIGFYDAEPACWLDGSGKPAGVFVDLFEEIAARNGWTPRWRFGTWDELLAGLRSGSIDVVPAIVRTEAREEFARFIEESVMLDWGAVFTGRGSEVKTILDLGGRKVGALENDYWFSGDGALRDLAAAFGVRPDYRWYPDYASLFAALGQGEIDAAAGSNSLGIIWEARYAIQPTPILYNPVDLRYAVSRGNPDHEAVAAAIDRAIAAIKKDSPRLIQGILAEYAVPIRSELVVPTWLLVLLGCLMAAAAAFLLILLRQGRRLAAANRELEAALAKLSAALAGREALLHEIQHRVKNNLQLIISLVNLQADSADSQGATETGRALRETGDRLYSLAAAESLLMDGPGFDVAGVTEFLADLAARYRSRKDAGQVEVSYAVELGDMVLPPGSAVPLALVANELAENCLMHGAGADGRVRIDFTVDRLDSGMIRLTVRDQGPGFPPGFSTAKAGRLGFLIIESLAATLGARLTLDSVDGALARLEFQPRSSS